MPDLLTAALHAATTTAVGLLGLSAVASAVVLLVDTASALFGRNPPRVGAVEPLRIVSPAERSRAEHPAGQGRRQP